MTDPRPPAHLAPYVDAIGVDAAMVLFLEFGGTELYLARDPRADSELVRVLGIDVARALGELAQSTILQPRMPLGKAWVAQVLAGRGLSNAEIARRLHTTDVTVRKYLKGVKRDRAALDADLRQYRLPLNDPQALAGEITPPMPRKMNR